MGAARGPAGDRAIERARPAIKEAGDHLIVGHTDLDKRVRIIAAQLGVALPNVPNEQQQGWLREMSAATGAEYEYKFANLLRAAHGKIFPAIGAVRNTTRNTLVRQLASDANQTVLDHITVLEKTGRVDFDAIANEIANASTASPTGPAAPAPGVPAPSAPAAEASGDIGATSRPSPAAPGTVNTGATTRSGRLERHPGVGDSSRTSNVALKVTRPGFGARCSGDTPVTPEQRP